MAEGDGVIQLEGSADGDGEFAHARLVGIAELGDGEGAALGINFDHGEVGLRVHPAHLGVHLDAVLEADLDLVRALDDVAVGEDVAFLADDDVRALSVEARFVVLLALLRVFALLAFAVLVEPATKLGRQALHEWLHFLVVGIIAEAGLVGHAHDDDGGRDVLRHFDEGLVELAGEFERGRGGARGGRVAPNQREEERHQGGNARTTNLHELQSSTSLRDAASQNVQKEELPPVDLPLSRR